MESREPAKSPSFWNKPAEILLFGAFIIVFGLILAAAGTVVGPEASQSSDGNLWPLVVWAGLGMMISGVGFISGKSWGYAGSIIIFSIAYLTSIIQAFQREFVWGIFLDPIVLSFLILPRIRSYFFKWQSQSTATLSYDPRGSIETIINQHTETSEVQATNKNKFVQAFRKSSNILTIILILGMISIVPVVAISVHAVSVTEVTLNILYPPGSSESNITSIWFGFSPKTVSGSMFTWGNGKMGLAFSLTNLGLFQQHSIDWFRVATPGFTLYSTGLPITVPDLATVDFHMVLQAPDYDFAGPVILEMHTT